MYGDPLEHPQTERYWGNVNPIGPRGVYDEAKRFAEAMTMAYHRYHKMDTRIVRIFNTYGPRMRPRDGRVVSNFIVQALCGEPLTLYGDGSQTRSFCYVDDEIEGIYRLFMRGDSEPTNIGNPDEYTVRQLAEVVLELSGSRSRVEYRPLPEDDPKVRRPDITRARRMLDWEPGRESPGRRRTDRRVLPRAARVGPHATTQRSPRRRIRPGYERRRVTMSVGRSARELIDLTPDAVERARDRFAVGDYHAAVLLLEEAIGAGMSATPTPSICSGCRWRWWTGRSRHSPPSTAPSPRTLATSRRTSTAPCCSTDLGARRRLRPRSRLRRSSAGPTRRAIRRSSGNRLANAHAVLAEEYRNAGALDESIAQYRRALELRPTYIDVRVALARDLLDAQRFPAAADELDRVLAAQPDQIEALLLRGLAAYFRGR